MEDDMETTEFYYLMLVLGAFGSFAAGMLAATLQYQAWQRRLERVTAAQPVRHEVAKPGLAHAA
jgi:hypothetical protein